MLRALIITIPKPGKEPTTPQSFRSIFLMNNDLKIFAKLIAQRLIDILPLLIHPDQSGFTKGRQTMDATHRLINIIHLAREQRKPSLLLALDAGKAFDRIHWNYLAQVLSAFGFSSPIFTAIMALNTNHSVEVYSSGMLSTPFSISNRTRQGCPLPPLLFIFNGTIGIIYPLTPANLWFPNSKYKTCHQLIRG